MRQTWCEHYKRNLYIGAWLCSLLYASAASAQSYDFSAFNNITMPFFGVPLTVLAMATAGALVGAGYTDPIDSRQKLYTLTIANTLFAAWFVILIPEWRGWELKDVAKPPLAGVIAAANCVVIPALFKKLPSVATNALSALGEAFGRFFNRGNKDG